MINCSYFSTNNLIFHPIMTSYSFKTHIVFLKLNTACKRNNYQEPRTKRKDWDWNWDWDWDCIFLIQLFNLFQNK